MVDLGELAITDNHMHIDPVNGDGLEAVKKFHRAGGRVIILVNKLTKDWGIRATSGVEAYKRLYKNTVELAEGINQETEVRAFPVLGIHPAEVSYLAETKGREWALETAKKVMDFAAGWVSEGKAVGLGEIGRPHYPVPEEILELSHEVMEYSFSLASRLDCAVQLHTGSIGEKDYELFAEMAERSGLSPEKVVKHFSPPFIQKGIETGVVPSIISKKGNILEALGEGNRFLMESDYIDDCKRPGAVVGPKSVPKVTLSLIEDGKMDTEAAYYIHREQVEKLYGVEI